MLKSTLISSAVGIMVFFSVHAHQSPDPKKNKENKNFVVIGAFGFQNNAVRFTEYVHTIEDMDAQYALNKRRNLYYVYSLVSEDKEEAINTVLKLRGNESFKDAWLFQGSLEEDKGKKVLVARNQNSSISNESEKTDRGIAKISNNDTLEKGINPSKGISNTSDESDEIENTSTIVSEEMNSIEPEIEKNNDSEIVAPIITEDYKLYINAFNSKKFKEVKGEVEIRDHKRNKKIKAVKSHELIGVNDPKNGDHTVRLVSRIFGYRPVEHIIDLDQPINDSTSSYAETIGDSIIVNFDLERLRRGEIAVMWNVLFFKDAAIMRPDSKDELNSLLEMLKENDNLKVKIHGHTNGNSHGKLLHLNLEDKDFFSLSGNHIEDVGSAKKLSEYRGYAIQHYLMEHGIDESRLEIKGWGGKKMMYDKHDPLARNNVRVEIEILEL